MCDCANYNKDKCKGCEESGDGFRVGCYMPTEDTPPHPEHAEGSSLGMRTKHLLWMLMEFHIHRYLLVNSDGRQDGAEKAHRHLNLCYIFVAAYCGCSEEKAKRHIDKYKLIHTATQELTSHMDEVIGFKLKGSPGDYDELAHKFFDKFVEVATTPLPAHPRQAKEREDD